jgi:hypothetical protein
MKHRFLLIEPFEGNIIEASTLKKGSKIIYNQLKQTGDKHKSFTIYDVDNFNKYKFNIHRNLQHGGKNKDNNDNDSDNTLILSPNDKFTIKILPQNDDNNNNNSHNKHKISNNNDDNNNDQKISNNNIDEKFNNIENLLKEIHDKIDVIEKKNDRCIIS